MSDSLGVELAIRHLSKDFGSTTVLRRIELTVAPGEFVAVVGRSGSGKSTLLRLITGLECPTSGQILLDGQVVSGIHPDVRVMFQDARLLPWLNVLDNVKIGYDSGATDASRALAALARVGLSERAREWPGVLSGGQRQRVALARALASEPKVLLLDEPLGALDALTRMEMQALIEQIWLQRKFTALLVTHDVAEAIVLADRVVLIDQGQIALDLPVTLPRPRERNQQFVRLERLVLDRIMRPELAPVKMAESNGAPGERIHFGANSEEQRGSSSR
ncbi:ABC transporter ATP-binding protein [Alicyclobacillus cycloheptanicus]|uniref:Sulfonate transport system ATP-binding protein n=1 Tax=Alicyclobacillus cycloheptanicus TaxID=1457 RepID=A0ABT9XHT1_9BACL|nr:ABC transporter ATP-binding protein [Alicyclobacillus cycloheptanicus]MDQ0189589.1 sulfonate transport system ATP-binding protein [Alicyclobacillus cycloheptanicus]WDL99900.1 ABC transporter ATP-binding protein [Alicyclobacillus cycloheptanicus]